MMPKGWSHNRLDSVCSKITDGAHHSPKSVDIGYPMYSVKDMSYSGFYENTARLIDEVDYLSLVNQNCKPLINDILIAKDGSILKHCFVVKENVEGVILSSIALLRPKLEKIYPEYIAQYFSQEWVKSFVVRALTSGSGVPRIILKDFKSIKIPLPPLPEQQKIAKILSTWDKAISTTECLIDNSTQQKKALMQQLLTGKKRLLDESGERFKDEWEQVSLEHHMESFTNGYAFSASQYKLEGIPIITMGNIGLDGKFNERTHKQNFWQSDSSLDKFLVNKDDLLIAMTDVTPDKNLIGRMTIVTAEKSFYLNQRVGLIRLKPSLDRHFLRCLSNSTDWRKYSVAVSASGVQANMSTKDIKKGKIKLPTIFEQRKVATVLTNADKEIELLKQQLADLQQEKKALMQVLLTGKKRVVVDGEVA